MGKIRQGVMDAYVRSQVHTSVECLGLGPLPACTFDGMRGLRNMYKIKLNSNNAKMNSYEKGGSVNHVGTCVTLFYC